MKKRLALFTLLALAIGCLFSRESLAQEVRASVDRNRIALDESLDLTVTVAGGEGRVDTGRIEHFKVLSRGTSTSIRIINGQTSRETALNYTLIPLKFGRLSIPPLAVQVGDTTLHTEEIVVQVSKAAPPDSSRQDIYVRSEVSKTDPYSGESITFYLRLYHAVRIADPSVQKLPDFENFSAKQLENRQGYRKIIDGREYLVQELAFVLTPVTPGETTIAPAMIRLDTYDSKKNSGRSETGRFFDDMFFNTGRRKTLQLKTDPIALNVRPLPPDAPGALPFSGLVGRFGIDSILEKHQLKVGDAATFTVTLAGTGNLMDVAPLEIQIPEGLKAYADAPEDSIVLTEQGYTGKKTFRTALVGISPGTFEIQPVEIRYFDTTEGRYKTLSSATESITVLPSTETDTFKVATGGDTAALPGLPKTKVEFTGRDILPVKEDLDALKSEHRIGLPLFTLLILTPGLIFTGVRCVRQFLRPKNDPAAIMAKRAQLALKAAGKNPDDRFLSHLSRALIAAILSRAGVKGESLTYREAEEILIAAGLDPDLARSAGSLLDQIDSGHYGGKPMDAGTRQTLLTETRSMVVQVLKQ